MSGNLARAVKPSTKFPPEGTRAANIIFFTATPHPVPKKSFKWPSRIWFRRFEAQVMTASVVRATTLAISSRRSFASAEITKELTGMEIGGVTPVGLPEDLPVWIDSLVMDAPKVIIGAGSRSAKIYLSPDNLLRFPNTHIVDGLSMPIVN